MNKTQPRYTVAQLPADDTWYVVDTTAHFYSPLGTAVYPGPGKARAQELATLLNSHQSLIDALEKLHPYADHDAGCAARQPDGHPCDCGFEAHYRQARAVLNAAKEA